MIIFININQPMKNYFLFLLLFIVFAGCKKAIENTQEDLVIRAMTDGQWKITSFTQNGTNITGDFSAYLFKYHSNKTVDAIKNGTIEKTGTWNGDAPSMSISAYFTSPPYPIDLINGNWHIDRNSWTYVEATQINGSETKTLRLDKL